jgi:poly-gamma-glutamate synthesis protein (capsule biosynthesis protein)
MTGVTALTRATAYQMAVRGETFPGMDIRTWLLEADLTHISHEVPFAENCPYPDPVQEDLIFCASPARIALFEDIGADIIELTGNHLLDFGEAAANLTVQMYRDRGWLTYAGGLNLSEAQAPAKITHNGNHLAFIGCNLPGPPNVWANPSKAGAASCADYGWLEGAIKNALSEGFLPIVTIQYIEDYSAIPSAQMESDFLRLAEAGAVVVNGSQAHTPKIMGFHQNSFVHFGLGNLFFDQMEVYYQDILMEGTRDEFINRLVFYDNRLVSVELLTAKLEDYARPRPMSPAEREAFLSRIFDLADDYQFGRIP